MRSVVTSASELPMLERLFERYGLNAGDEPAGEPGATRDTTFG